MEISLFLAQALGLFLAISGLGLIMQQSALKKMIAQLSSDRTTVMMGGILSLIVGIPLVLIHNVWEGSWQILITLLVWVTFLKGVTRTLMPDLVIKMASTLSDKMGMVKIMIWLMMVVGLYLLYVGFVL